MGQQVREMRWDEDTIREVNTHSSSYSIVSVALSRHDTTLLGRFALFLEVKCV